MKLFKVIPHSVSAGAIAAVVTSAGNVLLLRIYLHHLTKPQFGLWSLAIVFYIAVQQIAVSFVPALIKVVAEAIHSDRQSLARSYILTAFCFVIGVGLAGTVALPLIISLSRSALRVPYEFAGVWVSLIPLVWALACCYLAGEVLLSYITARGRITWTHAINSTGVLSSLVFSFFLFRAHPSILAIPLGLLCGRLLLVAVATLYLGRSGFGSWTVREVSFANLGHVGKIGYLYLGGALLSLGLFPLSKAILVRAAGLTAVAGFEIAYTFSLQLRNVIDVAMRGVLPEVAAISSKGDSDRPAMQMALSKLLRRYTILALVSSSGICLAGYLLSPVFFAIVGAAFGHSLYFTLAILLVGACLNAIGIPHFYALMGMGRGGNILTSYIVLVSTNVLALFGFTLLWRANEVFAAWAVLLSMLTSTAYLMITSSSLTGWSKVTHAVDSSDAAAAVAVTEK